MSLSSTGKRYSATGGRNRRKNKNKKTIQKLISVANEDKKKNVKHEQNSDQKNNNRQNKTQEIEKINGNGELSPSLLFLCFCPLQT